MPRSSTLSCPPSCATTHDAQGIIRAPSASIKEHAHNAALVALVLLHAALVALVQDVLHASTERVLTCVMGLSLVAALSRVWLARVALAEDVALSFIAGLGLVSTLALDAAEGWRGGEVLGGDVLLLLSNAACRRAKGERERAEERAEDSLRARDDGRRKRDDRNAGAPMTHQPRSSSACTASTWQSIRQHASAYAADGSGSLARRAHAQPAPCSPARASCGASPCGCLLFLLTLRAPRPHTGLGLAREA
jgi:hypothetical protein